MIKQLRRIIQLSLVSSFIFLNGCAVFQLVTHNKYIGDQGNKIYHHEHCSEVKRINPMEVVSFPDNACARYEGYRSCSKCNPDK